MRDDPGRRAPPSIPRTGDRRSRRTPGRWGCRVLCLVRPKANDVFCATRQPFDPGSSSDGCAADTRTSYAEGLWSPSLAVTEEKCGQKRTQMPACLFTRTLRVFLSQAGPRFDLVLLQAEHHLVVPLRVGSPPGTKKATRLGRPRLARSAARDLAQLPPSEGMDVLSGPTPRVEAVPARLERGDGRRLDDEHVGVDSSQHGLMVVAGSEHRVTRRDAQGFHTNI